MQKQKRPIPQGCWSLFVYQKLISLAIEPEVSLAFPGLPLHLEKDGSCVFAFLVPSALFCVSFPIPSGVSRIDSLL